MNSWPNKLVAFAGATVLCAGAAYAQTGNLVKIQRAPAFLQQATVVGPHAMHSTLNLAFVLKGNNAFGGLTPAELEVVEGYLHAHGIQVTGVSSGRTLMHTRGQTAAYDHALNFRLVDYTRNGQKFFSAPDPPRLPGAVAQYVTGVFAPASLRRVPGHYSTTNVAAGGNVGTAAVAASQRLILGPSPRATWMSIPPYPIPILDNCAAIAYGEVYSIGGVSGGTITPSNFFYQPGGPSWAQFADLPVALEKPVCGTIDNEIYVTDGDTGSLAENDTLYIYDPASDSWSTGPSLPASGTEFGAAGVMLDGKFYVIGGCDGATCSTFSQRVAVFGGGSWSLAQNYPIPIAWQGCGAAGNVIVCAGGITSSTTDTTAAYMYDPYSNSWTAIAPLLYDNWGMSATGTAYGQLLLQDGVTGGVSGLATNQGQMYNRATNAWTLLPPNTAAIPTFRAAGACGFYVIGGMDSGNLFNGITSAEELSGYDVCTLCPQGYTKYQGILSASFNGPLLPPYTVSPGPEGAILAGPQGFRLAVNPPGSPPLPPVPGFPGWYWVPHNHIFYPSAPGGNYTWGAHTGSAGGFATLCIEHP